MDEEEPTCLGQKAMLLLLLLLLMDEEEIHKVGNTID
jgi:hypothetical protein